MAVVILTSGALLSPLVAMSTAGADPALPFFPSPTIASLPQGAVSGQMISVSCASAGNCVSVGWAYDGTSDHGIYAIESNGTWGNVIEVADPSGSAPYSHFDGSQVVLTAVSCPAVNQCVAVGSYSDVVDGLEPLALVVSGSTVTLEPVAGAGDNPSALQGVSCWAVQQCTAVGAYDVLGGTIAPAVVSMTNGNWDAPVASLDQGTLTYGQLFSVSCQSATSCDAVGQAENGNQFVPITASESSGQWSAAQSQALPSQVVNGYLESVSCWSPGNCVAVGGANLSEPDAPVLGTRPLAVYALTAVETDGTWGAVAISPDPSGYTDSRFWGISCTGPGSCTALGDTSVPVAGAPVLGSADVTTGYLVVEVMVGGTWLPAQVMSSTRLGVRSVSCVTSAICTAVGYQDTSTFQFFFVTSLPTLTLTTTSLPNANPGVLYAQQLTVAGGTALVTYAVTSGSLPPGLALNAATGLISGTTSSTGSYTFTVTATDAGTPNQTATATFTLTSSLASTGFNLAGSTSIALLLLSTGAGLFAVGRRRNLLSDAKSN